MDFNRHSRDAAYTVLAQFRNNKNRASEEQTSPRGRAARRAKEEEEANTFADEGREKRAGINVGLREDLENVYRDKAVSQERRDRKSEQIRSLSTLLRRAQNPAG